jgi:hypothetical protein
VDDCSQDRTRDLIEKLLNEYHGRNFRKLYQCTRDGGVLFRHSGSPGVRW